MAAAVERSMAWHCCSDAHHAVLADRLVHSLAGCPEFAVHCRRVADLGGLPRRAAGGPPVMDFKLAELRRLAAVEAAPFVWSDVDVQALGPPAALRSALDAALATYPDADLLVQREFADVGCNVGFLVARPSARLAALVDAWRAEMAETRRLDQKVLNAMVLRGAARVARLPGTVWASSNAAPPPLGDLVLHHANFVFDDDRRPSSDPSPKLAQLDLVAALRAAVDAGDAAATRDWAALGARLAGDASLATYRARHFPDADGPAWAAVD